MKEEHPNETRDFCPTCPDLYRTKKLIGFEDYEDNTLFGGYQQCSCKSDETEEKVVNYTSCQNKFDESKYLKLFLVQLIKIFYHVSILKEPVLD